ncbi:MAG: zinc-dependent metalloprotease [Bacteroidota bacterium]
MWQNNAITATKVNGVLNFLNNKRQNNQQPVWPIPGVPFIKDARIRYELTGIYFYQSTILNTSNSSSDLENAVKAIDANRLNSLPIYYTDGYYFDASGYALTPIFQNFNINSGIVMFNKGSTNDLGGGTLDHELGHCFNLLHTYPSGPGASETNDKLSPEYLSDVFNVSWGNYCSPPINYSCLHYGKWNLDPYAAPTNSISTNNLMGGCAYNNYISPMQMGKMHRALATSNLRKYVKEMQSESVYPWIVSANETWDFDIQMYQDIVVKPGATLTIKCKVGMALNGRIIVERGARLIIDGGEVNAWGSTWEGIQVWGTSNQSQIIAANGLSTYQGIVQVINQGTITNAMVGISVCKKNANGNIDYSGYTGGIVMCDRAKFINNRKSIEYCPYHNYTFGSLYDNRSYVYRSLFEVNGILRNPGSPYPDAHISLWGVEGIRLYGNTYQNISSPLPAIEQRGNGITTYDGSYNLGKYYTCWGIDPCTGQCVSDVSDIPSRFINLNYGINAAEGSPLRSISADDNDFINCNRAILTNGTKNTVFTRNRIDIAQGDNLDATRPYGVYLLNSTSYTIKNNTITTTYAPNYYNNLATGILVYTSQGLYGNSNTIYRNTINNLNVGTTVVGDNSGGALPGNGLKFSCNQFGQTQQNYRDIWLSVGDYPWFNIGKIDVAQGNLSVGANNRFSHLYNDDASDFVTDGVTYVDYYFNPEASLKTTPFYYTANFLNPIQNLSTYNEGMCPAYVCSFGGGGGGGSTLRLASNSEELQDEYLDSIAAKIDGNNKAHLLNLINNSLSANNIRDTLKKYSPYLSDEVLMAYFNKKSTPIEYIKLLYDLNKPVTKPVLKVLIARRLPVNIQQDINLQQLGNKRSARTALETQMSDMRHKKAEKINNKLLAMLHDTINGFSPDSIVSTLKKDKSKLAQNHILSCYVATDQLSKAKKVIAEMKAQNNGKLDNFCRLQEIIVALKSSNNNIFSLKTDAALKAEVEAIAANQKDDAFINAQALLTQVFGTKFYEDVKLPSASSKSNKRMAQEQDSTQIDQLEIQNNNLMIYPNPSNQSASINYVLPNQFTHAEVIVYDLMGKQVLKQIVTKDQASIILPTQQLDNGVYFINLLIDDKITETQKFIKN